MDRNQNSNRMGQYDAELLFLTDEGVRHNIELMFFAYRDFTADPDRILEARGLGRAHHRALHFIHRRPDLTVSELLSILAITKQSLNRVLRKLKDIGYVEVRQGDQDRRERRLSLTDAGIAFEEELSAIQQARLREAFSRAGPEAVAGFRQVLNEVIDPEAKSLLKTLGNEGAKE